MNTLLLSLAFVLSGPATAAPVEDDARPAGAVLTWLLDTPLMPFDAPRPAPVDLALLDPPDPKVVATSEPCPCPHCPPGCNGRQCRYFGGPPCCEKCTCPPWGSPTVIPPDKPVTVPVVIPVLPPPSATLWHRVDSRGIRWTHANRLWLDRYVDGVERSYDPYAGRSSAAPQSAGGSCSVLGPAIPACHYYRGR